LFLKIGLRIDLIIHAFWCFLQEVHNYAIICDEECEFFKSGKSQNIQHCYQARPRGRASRPTTLRLNKLRSSDFFWSIIHNNG
jgi:hypothetical protein